MGQSHSYDCDPQPCNALFPKKSMAQAQPTLIITHGTHNVFAKGSFQRIVFFTPCGRKKLVFLLLEGEMPKGLRD